MGDYQTEPLRPRFDRRLRLEFHGATVTSDAGLLAYRELDDALRLTDSAADVLHDTRTGQNTRHGLAALLRQAIFSRLAGSEDLNDAQRLRDDPAMRSAVGGRARDHTAASPSEMARVETGTLTTRQNLDRLIDLSGQWIDHAQRHRKLTKIVLDMDSSVSETYGRQQGSAYNGHFGCTCYHPLFVFNQFGDLERVMLRRGNHHSAKFGRRVLLPVITRYRDRPIPKFFRGDAAFASPKLMKLLEAESYWYAIRLKANAVLERNIAHLLKRPVGRPSKTPKVFSHSFRYQAKSWDRARRVVAKVEWHVGELFPRVGFVVTNLRRSPKRVIKFYNGRGTAEQGIKGGQERPEVDAAIVLSVQGQSGPATTFRVGVQPGELPASTRAASAGADVVPDDPAREADQARREGGASRAGGDVPVGGGSGPARVVRGHPGSDRPLEGGPPARLKGIAGCWGRSPEIESGDGVTPRNGQNCTLRVRLACADG
jgi:hypothetical protein